MYKNLEITLPEEENVLEEDVYEDIDRIDLPVYDLKNWGTPVGIYTTGTATGMDSVNSLDTVESRKWRYKNILESLEYDFVFGEELRTSFVVPGMKVTNVKGVTCDNMIPQGITYYDGYFFIGAYCGHKTNDISKHDSVVFVIDGTSKSLITTLVLAKRLDGINTPHVGGIAYAGGYLWIGSTGELHCYKYSEIKELISYATSHSNVRSIALDNYTYYRINVGGNGLASFIAAYSNNILCVGEHNKTENGKLVFYYADPDNIDNTKHTADITVWTSREIPPKAQGIEFYSTSAFTYMIITTSLGYYSDSVIYVYRTNGNPGYSTLTNTKKITFPNMLEEVVTINGYTYFLFESCAKEYRSLSPNVISEVCGFSTLFIYK